MSADGDVIHHDNEIFNEVVEIEVRGDLTWCRSFVAQNCFVRSSECLSRSIAFNKWDEVDFVIMDSCFCHRGIPVSYRTVRGTGGTYSLDQRGGADQRDNGGNGRR